MASALPTSERVYRAVQAELLGPDFTPGDRIEAVQLARRHMTSITPVRAALHRLTGEGLVDARTGEGFHAPQVTEASLRDLYAWNGHIILLAWQLSPHVDLSADEAAPFTEPATPPESNAAAAATLFATLGERSGNEQCAFAIAHLNDQLHLVRRLETELIKATDDERRDLADKIRIGQPVEVRHLITAYHRRRIRLAPDLVRLVHRRRR